MHRIKTGSVSMVISEQSEKNGDAALWTTARDAAAIVLSTPSFRMRSKTTQQHREDTGHGPLWRWLAWCHAQAAWLGGHWAACLADTWDTTALHAELEVRAWERLCTNASTPVPIPILDANDYRARGRRKTHRWRHRCRRERRWRYASSR